MIAAVGIPFIGVLLAKKGIMWKLAGVYFFSTVFDAIYDTGMYLHFFLHAPHYMRKLLELEDTSLAAIQLRLFLRFCASTEIKRATFQTPRKGALELCIVRSFRN